MLFVQQRSTPSRDEQLARWIDQGPQRTAPAAAAAPQPSAPVARDEALARWIDEAPTASSVVGQPTCVGCGSLSPNVSDLPGGYASSGWGDVNSWDFWHDWLDDMTVREQAGASFDPIDPGSVPRPPAGGIAPQPGQVHPPSTSVADTLTRFCTQAGGRYLEPPSFADQHWLTQLCFHYEYGTQLQGWPAHDCPAPCILERDCEVPSLAEGVAAGMQVFVLPADLEPLPPPWGLLPPGTTLVDVSEAADFVRAAAALLEQNLDLVEWAVCIMASWSPNIGDPQPWVDCLLRGIRGEMSVYLLDRFFKRDGSLDGATGGATQRFSVENGDLLDLPSGKSGSVVPIGHPKWTSAASAYQDALHGAGTCQRALCALTWAAGTILHEMLHQCAYELTGRQGEEDPTWDGQVCWAVQNMSAMAFGWAMTQRYPALQQLACCPAYVDEWFATSEELVPSPFPWNEGAPC